MSLYRKICYKVEDFFIKRMSKSEKELKINMEKANFYRKSKKSKKNKEKEKVVA
ncbi:hypothetical protein [Romboutsia sp.]|uniref:hypothetical protein n=1 Tax=Romboutsia sp. TaxID=1965302 RepID=UPI003F37DCE7